MTIIQFDYNVLANYYSSGAALSRSVQAGALRSSTRQDTSGVVPPWKQNVLAQLEAEDRSHKDKVEDIGRFLTQRPVINLKDPQVDQPGASENFKNLFALHKALAFLSDLADVAQGTIPSRNIFELQFQRFLGEIKTFTDDTRFGDIALVSGIKRNTMTSTIDVSAATTIDTIFGLSLGQDFIGKEATTVRENSISGIAGTEQITIDVTQGTTEKSITIDLGGETTLDEIADTINAELLSNGVVSSFNVQRFNASSFGLRIDVAAGETLTLSTSDTGSAAVYAAGTLGSGTLADGFVIKLDDLGAADPNEVFTEGISTDKADSAKGIAVDSEGNVYVVGTTEGDLGEQGEPGIQDVYLRKFDGSGNLLNTIRLGAAESATGFAVAVDSEDNVVVVGSTLDSLTATSFGGNTDTFVTKFDNEGTELFTRQASPYAADSGLAVTFDSNDDIIVTGVTASTMIGSSDSNAGGNDAFVSRIDGSTGDLDFTAQFGGSGDDSSTGVAVDSSGNIFVTANVGGDAVVRKYDSTGTFVTELDLGTLSGGDITGIAIDADDDIYVTGYTSSTSFGGGSGHAGGTDAFVAKITDSGTLSNDYTTFVGSSGDDRAFALAVNGGEIYISGDTSGSIDGETQHADVDAFIGKLTDDNTSITLDYAHQFGTGLDHSARAIAFDSDGTNVLTRLGLHTGDVPPATSTTVAAQTSARVDQSFTFSIDGGPSTQFTIEEDDTMELLAARLNRALGTSGEADLVGNGHTARLLIKALNGAVIDINAGPDGYDALHGLGFEPARLIGELQDFAKEEAQKGSAFQLGLFGDISIATEQGAKDAKSLLDSAMLQVRKAFRFLTEGPEPEDPFAGITPPPPPLLAARISAFQAALDRIQAFNNPDGTFDISVRNLII